MMKTSHDVRILRKLAQQYIEIASAPEQEARRKLWTSHNSLRPTPPPVLTQFSWWNAWYADVFNHQFTCQDPFFREHERTLHTLLYHANIGDDTVFEPWITQRAVVITHPLGLWGVAGGDIDTAQKDLVWNFKKPIKSWGDMDKLIIPEHRIDEAETTRRVELLQEAVGDILPVNIDRGPAFQDFAADISQHVALLRGHDQLMIDMLESPAELHRLLAFLRDGILKVHAEAETAGDWSLTSQSNQGLCYAEGLEAPRANSGARQRKDLWCHVSAQEYTLVSPKMHEEFLLQYQLPIISQFGLVAYGCCENLTHKINMLRQVPNLRIIAVTPTANLARCAEQIGTDYVISWRPNPVDMVSAGFDPQHIRKIVHEGLEITRGCHMHICLKDVENVEGEPERLKSWTVLVKQIIEEFS
jgi:hypothetical protein